MEGEGVVLFIGEIEGGGQHSGGGVFRLRIGERELVIVSVRHGIRVGELASGFASQLFCFAHGSATDGTRCHFYVPF